MEGKARVEEQLELFNEETGETKKVDPNTGEDLGIKEQKREIVEAGADPEAPFVHFVQEPGKSIQTGDILAHWVLTFGELSVQDCVKALHKHAGDFLETMAQGDSKEAYELGLQALVKVLGDHVALQGCLMNMIPAGDVDNVMTDILNGKIDILIS